MLDRNELSLETLTSRSVLRTEFSPKDAIVIDSQQSNSASNLLFRSGCRDLDLDRDRDGILFNFKGRTFFIIQYNHYQEKNVGT